MTMETRAPLDGETLPGAEERAPGPAFDLERPPEDPAPAAPERRSKKKLVLAAVAAIAAVVGGRYWITHRGLESTDDAQVDGELVAVPARTSAVVTKVLFTDNQLVHEGELLAEVDDAPAKAKLAQAEAALAAASAQADAADADARVAGTNAKGNKSVAAASLVGAQMGAGATKQQIEEGEAQVKAAQAAVDQAALEKDRDEKLFSSGAISKAEVDRGDTAYTTAAANLAVAKARLAELRASQAQAGARVQEASARVDQTSDVDAVVRQAQARAAAAHAQVATAKALRDLAALELSYTEIRAPQEGIASKKSIAVGQMVQPGAPIAMLVPTRSLWITGNFKETQLAHMKVGQRAKMEVDAYPGVELDGEVESFSAATGAKFALLPPDNASGNYTKVVQRVSVRVKLVATPADVALRPGMSVDLAVDTRR